MEDAKERCSVEFLCDAPQAKEVFLAGTFNGWDPTIERLAPNKFGEWRTSLFLEPGRYEYKFVVDGKWICNPNCKDEDTHLCPHCVRNEFGAMNRVLIVK